MTSAPASELSTSPLTLTLFGPMQVLVNGNRLPPLRSRKGLWLLALLTLRHGKPVEREWLSGTLWPELPQSHAFANLRPILSDLRSRLGSESARIQSPTRDTLLLDLTGAIADVLTFDAALRSNDRTRMDQAVALYRGPLLEGCAEEWVFQERLVREHACLQALQSLADAAMADEDFSTAVGYYQRSVGIDPLLDTARRGWMEALARGGDRNAALQVYREFLELLRSDPNAEPDPETTALYARLRTEARQPLPATPPLELLRSAPSGYLPHPLTEMVGREDECLEVIGCLRRSRLVTLTGIGGIGKTRLAIRVASEIVENFADGIWLTPLESISEGKQIASQIAAVLGLQEEAGASLLQSVTNYLRSRRALLVIDNCEHLLEPAAQIVHQLLQACNGLRILATSRAALGVTGESVWPVPSLPFPKIDQLPSGQLTLLRVLTGYESVQLFVERAQAAQKGFALTGRNGKLVAEVCTRLEGIPLAIEIVAPRLRAMTIEQINTQLQEASFLNAAGSRTAAARHQTLEAALDWSYTLLTPPERTLLARLSVFSGGWSLEAAAQVCACDQIQPTQFPNLLTSLVDHSLILFEETGSASGGRYRMLEMVRQYAAARLPPQQWENVHTRHRDWCLALVEEYAPQIGGRASEGALHLLETELDNLYQALGYRPKDTEEAQSVLSLAAALLTFWYYSGRYSDSRHFLALALEQTDPRIVTPNRAKALYGLGIMATLQGDYPVAQPLIEESLTLSRQLGDRRRIASSLNELGIIASDQGDYRAAQAHYEESLVQWRELGAKDGIADALGNLASVAYDQSDFSLARTLFAESLRHYEELEMPHKVAWAQDKLGMVAMTLNDYRAAEALFEESLSRRRDLGAKRDIGESLGNLGVLKLAQGDFAAALNLTEQKMEIDTELSDRRGMAWSLVQQGEVKRNQDDPAAAQRLNDGGLEIYRQIGFRRGLAIALNCRGALARDRGDYAAAWAHYQEGLNLYHEMGTKASVASILEGMAGVLHALGDLHRATIFWGAAHAVNVQFSRSPSPLNKAQHESAIVQARSALGANAFAVAWQEGDAMTWEQAVAYAQDQLLSL